MSLTPAALGGRHLVVEDDTQQGTVNLQAPVVVNEAQLPKLVHEETHPGPRSPDHFGQDFLAYPGHDGLMLPVLAELGQKQNQR